MRLLQNPVAADVSPLRCFCPERQRGLTSAATGLRNAPASWTAAALCRFGRAKSAGGSAHSPTWRTPRRDCDRIPTGFRNQAQGCAARATLGQPSETDTTLKGLRPSPHNGHHNPVGVGIVLGTFTQGSRSAPTLGWWTQSRWDCWRAMPTTRLFPAARPRRGRIRIVVGETHGPRSEELCDPAGVERIGQRLPWVDTHGCSRSVPSGHQSVVAQSCTLPYRRFVIGRASNRTTPPGNLHTSQNAILRYSRLQVCATGGQSRVPAPEAIRPSAFGFPSDFHPPQYCYGGRVGFRSSDFTP